MRFSKAVVKLRIPILILVAVLMIPSLIGMAKTRINYDMLNYLPDDMETVTGQEILLDEFGKGAFSFIIVEGMEDKDVAELKKKVEEVDHVATVIWPSGMADAGIPQSMLPDKLYEAYNTDDCMMMAVFFDTSTSADETMDAIQEIRTIAGEHCFVSGMSALVKDLKDLCEEQEPVYVALAVILACTVMVLLLDGWLVPFLFLASIGIMILINLGTNLFLGEISYITKALSAVLQLAVTMDYSIFLWHSYNEQLDLRAARSVSEEAGGGAGAFGTASGEKDSRRAVREEAMAVAIHETLESVLGSSITTVAGFIALCFMSFTLGKDLGIVMAKGVVLGVIGCVTVLPALILLLDKPLQKTRHRSLIPDVSGMARRIVKMSPVFLVIFVLMIPPALYGYHETNEDVYYNMISSLPDYMPVTEANAKLEEEFNMASTHMLLVDADLDEKDVRAMIAEMQEVDGVKAVLGLESILGSSIPEDFLPDSLTEVLKSDNWELMVISSEYAQASDEVNAQIDELKSILKSYDSTGMIIGEASCMKDMIDTTAHDFNVVNAVSILAIFLIILLVQSSISLPFILIAVIEFAIFLNMGIPHYLGVSVPFIAPVCISTIQLGATVDYAILMTTRYKRERIAGQDKREAVYTAVRTSIPSILISGLGLFAATFGVAVYSDIDIISSLCTLMARGAVISMISVITVLPALLLVFDRVICATTKGMRGLYRTAE